MRAAGACQFATPAPDCQPATRPAETRSARLRAEPDPDCDPPPVAEGILRVDAISAIPAVLRDLGAAPAALLVEAGLDPGLFDDPRNEIPVQALGRFFRLAVERTGCPHFGLLVGERSGLASLGLVGLLAQHSPDVGAALRNLTGHLHVRDRGAVASLVVRGGVATLDYAIYATGVEASDQIYDGALAISSNALRTLCGPDWHPTEVLFCHSKPADASPFRRVFDGPLRFDAEQTAIVFPVTWLAHRLCGADSAVYRRLERRVGALKEQADDDPVAALRRLLRTLLLGGSGSVANVAKHLAMHRRTLNRRLEARGTSVHELVEEIRFEVARQLVELTRMPLVEISAALGYADPSAFTRAFRRWSGITPSEWRASRSRGGANQRGPGPPAQAPAARAPARRPKKLPSASEMPLL